MKVDPHVTCIYCRQVRPSSREHVLHDGLGGHTAVGCVCGPCNQGFGNGIDRELLRESPIALRRILAEGANPERDWFEPRPEFGGFLDFTKVGGLPQVFNPDNWTVIDRDDGSSGLESLLTSLPERIHHAIDSRPFFTPTRLVLKDGKLKIRATDASLAMVFEEHIRRDATVLLALLSGQKRPLSATDSPRVLTLNCDPNAPARSMAKMVFNLFARVWGPEMALHARLDGLRDFITGDNVKPTWDGLIDTRYVTLWPKPDGPMVLAPSNVHAIMFDPIQGHLLGSVVLWGEHQILVDLGYLDDLPTDHSRLAAMLVSTAGVDHEVRGVREVTQYRWEHWPR